MKTTMRSAAAAAVMAVLLAACGGSPTSSAPVEPVGPSYDGGYGVGSGNREAPADSVPGPNTSSSIDAGGFTVDIGS